MLILKAHGSKTMDISNEILKNGSFAGQGYFYRDIAPIIMIPDYAYSAIRTSLHKYVTIKAACSPFSSCSISAQRWNITFRPSHM